MKHPTQTERWSRLHDTHTSHAPGRERATRWVLILTVVTMIIELVVGYATGSMALVADGWHMSSHAVAMALAWLVYVASRSARFRSRMSFGTGKLNALGGYTSALILGGIALATGWQSVERLIRPIPIGFDAALTTAVAGLLVNVVSAWLLRDDEPHEADHGHAHTTGHVHAARDHNHRAAFLHVVADACTSVLAILALWGGRAMGWTLLDPLIGLVGMGLVLVWTIGLIRDSSRTLLDFTPSCGVESAVRETISQSWDADVADVHIWEFGPGQLACQLSLVAHEAIEPERVRESLAGIHELTHVTVEVNRCAEH